jgi:nucleoside 2-deoxyribosyltransferase
MQVEIRNARFIIADLTDANLNVLWEAGFAKGLDKPVIYTCKIGKEHSEKIKKQMFDINHDQYIEWDPKNPEEAVELLKAVIRNTLPTEAKMEDEVAG